jgi:phosphoglycolate phosphatase
MKIGIIFDLDGTLWDATENITNAWNDVLEKSDYKLKFETEVLVREMGKLVEDIADSLFPMIEGKKRYELLWKCIENENHYLKENGGNLYEGVEETLKKLNEKYKVMIVSNGQLDYVKTFIDFFDFGQYIADYEEAGRTGKPKADNIKMVIDRNQLEKAFYVGDTLGDMESAKKAGACFIHAAYGFGTVPDDSTKIDDIRDLPDLINNLMEN